jgi:hypothetical protein
VKSDQVFALALLALGAYALMRARSGATNLFGAPVTLRESAVSSWISSLPPEVDWRQRPEFNKPWLPGDLAQAGIFTAANVFVPGAGTALSLVSKSQER